MAILFVDSLSRKKNKVFLSAVKALEVMLLSAGLISTLIMVIKKGAIIPYSCELVFSSLIGFWNSVKCFFFSSPLHICIIINFMVVLIALSSTFHGRCEITNQQDDDDIRRLDDHIDVCHVMENLKPPPAPPPPSPPPRPRDIPVVVEPPPHHDENDTMEATWKSITRGGKQRTKKKQQLKKTETWERSVNMRRLDSEEVMPSSPKWKELRKAETFNDAVSITRRGGLIRRVPSISMDDFNKKVEAFIKKGIDNMKLQRQESDQRFLDMINKGL